MPGVFLTESLANRRGESLACHYWYPPTGKPIRGLVFLSHGFSEHLGLYQEVGQFLSDRGYLAFGHDHVGHGSSEGKRVYIESVDMYVDDVVQHSILLQEKHPSLPLFLVGHSMGGMVALSCVLRKPELFQGFVLNGPLIVPGPQIGPLDLRSTPWRTYVGRTVLGLLSYVIPEVCIGGPNLQVAANLSSSFCPFEVITRDKEAQAVLEQDKLRWTGGCKVMLLYAFCIAMGENMERLGEIRTPFLTLHGSADKLCNPLGSELLYRQSPAEDKSIKVYPGAKHQLFLEFPAVRKEALGDIADWMDRREGS